MAIKSNTQITAKIDWISITSESFDFPECWEHRKRQLPHGLNGYDVAYEFLDGRLLLSSTTREDMKCHLIMSGSTINRLCETHQKTSFEICKIAGGDRLSRLDVAVDVKKGSLNIKGLRDEFEAGNVDTRAEKALYMAGVGSDGETLYIGSQKSAKRLRVYDKAAESGEKIEWTRLELQLRSKYATSGYRIMNATDNPGRGAANLINGFVNFPTLSDWFVVFGGNTDLVPNCEITTPNRDRWLMDTATSALANEMLSSGKGSDLLERFIKETLKIYAKKKEEFR